jgi:hypothetical protein
MPVEPVASAARHAAVVRAAALTGLLAVCGERAEAAHRALRPFIF